LQPAHDIFEPCGPLQYFYLPFASLTYMAAIVTPYRRADALISREQSGQSLRHPAPPMTCWQGPQGDALPGSGDILSTWKAIPLRVLAQLYGSWLSLW